MRVMEVNRGVVRGREEQEVVDLLALLTSVRH